MFGLLAKLWGGLKALPGMLLPFLAKAKTVRSLPPWLRWTLHLLLLATVLVGLAYVNHFLDLEKVLRMPWPFMRKIWLPLLFLQIYILAWLGWWLWQLLGPEEKTSAFPEIDAAWTEALLALDKAGINLDEAPLFLVLGQPQGTEESLFAASGLPLQVRNVPRRPAAPLHVFASRDGIFVTCAGTSLLARQAALLAEAAQLDDGAGQDLDSSKGIPFVRKRGTTLHWQAVGSAGASGQEPTAAQGLLGTAHQAETGGPLGGSTMNRRRHVLLQHIEEVELLTARMRHLGQLIGQGRRPYCPINGLLFLVPWVACASDTEAQETGRICQRELNTLREVLKVQCPVIALVCDLEAATGFSDLFDRLPEVQRQQRLGRSFPLVPDVPAEALPGVIQEGIQWMCDTLIPTLVYRLLRMSDGDRTDAVAANTRLYQLLTELRQRRQRLANLVQRAVVRPERGATLFGGCYLAATGRDAAREQAFVAGIFPLLLDNQNFVAWTSEALAEEAAFQRWTRYGYACLGALVLVLLAGGYFFWSR